MAEFYWCNTIIKFKCVRIENFVRRSSENPTSFGSFPFANQDGNLILRGTW